jgi:putative hemolysin
MEIAIIFFLILLNGFFSMSEIALVSSRKFKLEAAAKKGSSNAKQALELANNPNTFLSAVQIGITLIGILTGIYSGEQITEDVNAFIMNVPFLVEYAHSVSVVIVLIVLTFFSIVFGELVPKRIGLTYPETIAMFVAKPMIIVSSITKPFIWLLTKTNDLVLRLFGIKERQGGIVSEEEIKSIIQDSTESGEIQEIEQNIVSRVFALGDRSVRELMTHRSDLICLDINDDLDTVRAKTQQEVHSVYPVTDGSWDKLVGVMVVKELFPLHLTRETFQLQPFIRKPLFVHENTPVYVVLEQFKANKLHTAIIVDEYGDVEGMIAMDDVVDALLGDTTEYNQEDYQITQRDEASWLADGQVPYYEFAEYFNLTDQEDEDGDYNTLAGFLLHQLHHIPHAGEVVEWKGFRFEIMDMDGRRIDKVLITTR